MQKEGGGGWRLENSATGAPEAPDVRAHERRLLSGFTLVLLLSAVILGMLVLPRWINPAAPTATFTFQAGAGVLAVTGLVAWLNRLGHYTWAASLFVGQLLVAPSWAAFDRPEMLAFLFIGVLAATALLPLKRAIAAGAIAFLAHGVVLLHPDHRLVDIVFPLSVNSIQVALVLVVRRAHAGLERARLSALRERERQERSLVERLERAARFESLGRLAGGVAHDFNNLLTVIGGGLDLALQEVKADDPIRADLEDVLEATTRAVGLTRQLLAFSRRQVLQPRVLELNEAVNSAARLLKRMLRENIDLKTELGAATGHVLVDPVQLEQVIVNLAINGADAMPRGGQLTLSTDAISLAVGEHASLVAGKYALLRVADVGSGMDKATLDRAFEPFFSTKETGRGTGLGLATVHGVVEQSGGTVLVDTAPGKGSTFTVLLPSANPRENATPVHVPRHSWSGARVAHTILIVEDDAAVRRLAERVLSSLGYVTHAAESGEAALEFLDVHTGELHLLITDIVMPKMTGPDVADAVRARHPLVTVLFISGYADEVVAREGMRPEEGLFLEKPFTSAALAAKVKAALMPQS